MSITAKELAVILGISPAAVSIALNNRPGVSEETRRRVIEAAKNYGCKTGVLRTKECKLKTISFVLFKKKGADIVDNTPFFASLTEGVSSSCRENGYSMDMRYIYDDQDIGYEIEQLLLTDPAGIILLATEMTPEDFRYFEKISIPMIILDTYFQHIVRDYVVIDNHQGAFLATDTLIKVRQQQPGYLHSSYSIGNFEERADGYYKAIRCHNMSPSKSIVHLLPPTIEGAYLKMSSLLDEKVGIADCYFADNDMIATGAMRAFREHGYRIPQDVAFVGFDNAFPENVISPPLTTINVPKQVMGSLAVERLVTIISRFYSIPVKTQLLTTLISRSSL